MYKLSLLILIYVQGMKWYIHKFQILSPPQFYLAIIIIALADIYSSAAVMIHDVISGLCIATKLHTRLSCKHATVATIHNALFSFSMDI